MAAPERSNTGTANPPKIAVSREQSETVPGAGAGSNTRSRTDGKMLTVSFSGDWHIAESVPDAGEAFRLLKESSVMTLALRAEQLGHWDTSLATLCTALTRAATERNVPVHRDASLPEGVGNLIDLALTVAPHKSSADSREEGLLAHVGAMAMGIPAKTLDVLNFLGEITQSLGRMVRGKAVWNFKDVWLHLQESSVSALPIVALISLLVGLILAFVGVVQLKMFGAEIYVSSLVAIGMTRIMGAIMTGIVLAGRTGASYAAIIGSMQVNEEVDALVTIGVPPSDYLVLPRLVALTLMTPLLVLYADFMGIIGGFLVGSFVLDIDALDYLHHTRRALAFSHILAGVIHGFAFGIVVAIVGCYQGLRSGRSAEAVGQATTSAVVTAIVYIIIVTAILTILFNIIGL